MINDLTGYVKFDDLIKSFNGQYITPPLYRTKNSTHFWMAPDTEELFHKQRAKNFYDLYPFFTYQYNSYGYRADEFEFDNPNNYFKIMSIGCSNTEGIGLPIEHTWAQRLCDNFSKIVNKPVKNYNLGIGGASNDSIVMRALQCIPLLNPDVVFICSTYTHRKIYITEEGEITEWWSPDQIDLNSSDPIMKKKIEYFKNVQSDKDDQFRIGMSFALLQKYLDTSRIPYCFVLSFLLDEDRKVLTQILNNRHCFAEAIPTHIRYKSYARDMKHTGPHSHEWIADNLFEWYKLYYGTNFTGHF